MSDPLREVIAAIGRDADHLERVMRDRLGPEIFEGEVYVGIFSGCPCVAVDESTYLLNPMDRDELIEQRLLGGRAEWRRIGRDGELGEWQPAGPGPTQAGQN